VAGITSRLLPGGPCIGRVTGILRHDLGDPSLSLSMNQEPVGADARAANTGGRQGLPATLGQDGTPDLPVRPLSTRHIVQGVGERYPAPLRSKLLDGMG